MPQFDWEPICQFVNEAPVLVEGRCANCLQTPFAHEKGEVCGQCGTLWTSRDAAGVCYRDWTTNDPEGIPVMDRRRKGLGVYR